MAGHSEYANIKHKKDRIDARKGQLFTKLAKEICVAAKGGADVNFNPRLRAAIEKAKNANMTKDSVERAIKKGTGELEGEDYLEIRYEGYGPQGVAFVIEALTDNKNRTAPEMRFIFSRCGGSLGETGGVGWMFEKRGIILVDSKNTTEDKLMEVALDAGAEDIQTGDVFQVICGLSEYEAVKKAISDSGIKIESSQITMITKNNVKITDQETAEKLIKLYENLEDHDDVQEVYANFEIDEEILKKL